MEQPSVYTNEENKPRRSRIHGVWWGLVLILGGILIFAQQAGMLGPRYNWWALFILIPAFGTLSGAVYGIQQHHRITNGVLASIGSAVVIFTVAFMFLFGLNWVRWWPLMLLAPGFSLLLGGIETKAGQKKHLSYINMAFWLGLGTMFLGAGFLAKNMGWFPRRPILRLIAGGLCRSPYRLRELSSMP